MWREGKERAKEKYVLRTMWNRSRYSVSQPETYTNYLACSLHSPTAESLHDTVADAWPVWNHLYRLGRITVVTSARPPLSLLDSGASATEKWLLTHTANINHTPSQTHTHTDSSAGKAVGRNWEDKERWRVRHREKEGTLTKGRAWVLRAMLISRLLPQLGSDKTQQQRSQSLVIIADLGLH